MDDQSSGYKTKQRELVLEYIKNSGRCVTADEIIKGLNENGEAVSKPTVYRTLERFVKNGEITRYVSEKGDSSAYRFGGEHHSEHFHIKCTECKRTVCMDCGFINDLEKHVLSHHGFTLFPNQTILYGICDQCRKKSSG